MARTIIRRSMEEIEPAHETPNKVIESHIRSKESGQASTAAEVHAHEKATVPNMQRSEHTAVKRSVREYVERSSMKSGLKGLRRHRN